MSDSELNDKIKQMDKEINSLNKIISPNKYSNSDTYFNILKNQHLKDFENI